MESQKISKQSEKTNKAEAIISWFQTIAQICSNQNSITLA